MIAGCPKCAAKYRVDPQRIGPQGARLQCAKCGTIFRVQAPPAPIPTASAAPAAAPTASAAPPSAPQTPAAPAPQPTAPQQSPAAAATSPVAEASSELDRERLVLIADPDVDQAKRSAASLAECGLQTLVVHDGVEAMLAIQRSLPRAVVLDAGLPKMFGFQVCEVVKRNESLRSIHVALVASVHDPDRYRRPPSDLYGADIYLEQPALLETLIPALQRFGLDVREPAAGAPAEESPPAFEAPARDADATPQAAPTPSPSIELEAPAAAPEPTAPAEAPAPPPTLELETPAPPAEPQRGEFGDSFENPFGEEELDAGPSGGADLAGADADAFDADFALGDEPLRPDQNPTPGAEAASDPSLSFAFDEPQAPAPAAAPVPAIEIEPAATQAPAIEIEPPPTQAPAPEPAAPVGDDLADERAQAERLARIIVSDIVLYNPEKFAAAASSADVVTAMEPDLAEGRVLFSQRVDARVRDERDFIGEELTRVAKERSSA